MKAAWLRTRKAVKGELEVVQALQALQHHLAAGPGRGLAFEVPFGSGGPGAPAPLGGGGGGPAAARSDVLDLFEASAPRRAQLAAQTSAFGGGPKADPDVWDPPAEPAPPRPAARPRVVEAPGRRHPGGEPGERSWRRRAQASSSGLTTTLPFTFTTTLIARWPAAPRLGAAPGAGPGRLGPRRALRLRVVGGGDPAGAAGGGAGGLGAAGAGEGVGGEQQGGCRRRTAAPRWGG